MEKKRIFVLSGVPGSGKSTLAKQLHGVIATQGRNRIIIENDAIRQMITGTNSQTVNKTYRWPNADFIRDSIKVLKMSMIEGILMKGQVQDIILDATHFNPQIHDFISSICEKYGAQLINIRINIDHETALQRAQNRERKEDLKTIEFVQSKLDQLNIEYDYVIDTNAYMQDVTKIAAL